MSSKVRIRSRPSTGCSVNKALTMVSIAALAAALGYAYWASRDRSAAAPATETLPSDQHAAPFDAFARANVGDWRAYRVMNGGSLGEIRTTAIEEVTDASEREVAVAWHGRVDATGEQRAGRPTRFPRTGLSLERLLGYDAAGWTVLDLAVTDDVRVVAGRSFKCKKLVVHERDPMFPEKQTRVELWLSDEVPVTGIVAEREHQELRGMTFDIELDVIGFGTRAVVAWGERPHLD